MNKITLVIILLFSLSFGSFLSQFGYRQKIACKSTIGRFIYVDLSRTAIWGHCKSDLSDVIVADSLNNVLSRKIGYYDTTAHKGELYYRGNQTAARVPYYIYYGLSTMSFANTYTFDSTCVGAYLFDQPLKTYGMVDYSISENVLVSSASITDLDTTTGKFGLAWKNDGSHNTFVNGSCANIGFVGSDFTIEIIASITQTLYQNLIGCAYTSSWFLYTYLGKTDFLMKNVESMSAGGMGTGIKHYIFRYRTSDRLAEAICNDSIVSSHTFASDITDDYHNLNVGYDGTQGTSFSGAISTIRLWNERLSDARIADMYANEFDQNNYVTIGTEEKQASGGGGNWWRRHFGFGWWF